MKKTVLLILSVVLLAVCLAFPSFAAGKVGDVNGDGNVTAADARLVLRHSASLEKLSEPYITYADADGNGKITAADARLILRVAANLDSFADEQQPLSEPTTTEPTTSEEPTTENIVDSKEAILAKYTEVMNHLKKNATTYVKKEYQDLIDVDFSNPTLSEIANSLLHSFLITESKAEIQHRDDYEQIPVIGCESGCLLTDASALKTASMSVDGGKTTITLVLHDETNPKPTEYGAAVSPSNTGAVFNPVGQEEIMDAFGGLSTYVELNKCDLHYSECTATLVFDSDTLYVESLEQVMNIAFDMNIKVGFQNESCRLSLRNVMQINNVNYDKNNVQDPDEKPVTEIRKDDEVILPEDVQAFMSDEYYLDCSFSTRDGSIESVKMCVTADTEYTIYSDVGFEFGLYNDSKKIYVTLPEKGIYTPLSNTMMKALRMTLDSMDLGILDTDDSELTAVTSYTQKSADGSEITKFVFEYDNGIKIVLYTSNDKLSNAEYYNNGVLVFSMQIYSITKDMPQNMIAPIKSMKKVSATSFLASFVR